MLKKTSSIVFALILVIFSTSSVFGKTYVKPAIVPKATATPTPAPVVEINSFELFWPMVAGKTAESKLYTFKLLKESVREFLIFDKAKKADYEITLAEKRMLEAEALINGGKTDLANSTLDRALGELSKADTNLENAKSGGEIGQDTKDGINNRLGNLKKFLVFMIGKNASYKDKLQQVLDKVNLVSSRI